MSELLIISEKSCIIQNDDFYIYSKMKPKPYESKYIYYIIYSNQLFYTSIDCKHSHNKHSSPIFSAPTTANTDPTQTNQRFFCRFFFHFGIVLELVTHQSQFCASIRLATCLADLISVSSLDRWKEKRTISFNYAGRCVHLKISSV